MKRLMFGGLVALGLMLAARPARADFLLQWNVCRNLCIQRTAKQRCITFSSHCNPICCPGGGYGGYGYGGLWGAYYAYGAYGAPYYGGLASAAPAAAAPAAATTTPSFTPPQPTPAAGGSVTPTGLQQAGYFYYPPPAGAGYGYGYDYGAGYSQAPNYWY